MTVMKPIIRILLLLVLLLSFNSARTQEVIASGSGNASGTDGSVTFTVGQTVYQTKPGTTGTVSEGVQQPCEILYFYGIEDNGITLKYSVSPNPAESFIRLLIEDRDPVHFSCQITDLRGVTILDQKISGKETMIPLESLPSASYFLRISENDKPITVYKIIKK